MPSEQQNDIPTFQGKDGANVGDEAWNVEDHVLASGEIGRCVSALEFNLILHPRLEGRACGVSPVSSTQKPCFCNSLRVTDQPAEAALQS